MPFKGKPPAPHTVSSLVETLGHSWRELPNQTIQNTAKLTGRSSAHVYKLIEAGKLEAIWLEGKTLVTTRSVILLLEGARPWRPNRKRVEAANRKRAELLA